MSQEPKKFVLFVNTREYDGDKSGTGETSLGELVDNFYCIDPENAEVTGDMMFIDYIEENGERVGVKLLCDPGYVNESGAPIIASLRLGDKEKYKFAHTDRANGGAVGRIRGYTLKLYETGHTHHHEHDDDHEHKHEHGGCTHDCSTCSSNCSH